MDGIQQRKRSRVACETCRELKRKCDGANPCATCVRFEYQCTYSESSRKKRPKSDSSPSAALPIPVPVGPRPQPMQSDAVVFPTSTSASRSYQSDLSTVEANSGAAFVRRLALGIDPKNAPRMHLFAWNAFLGARETAGVAMARPVTEILSQREMTALASVYFDKIDPCYGFIKRTEFDRQLEQRWALSDGTNRPYDAVLCGVAALACLFSYVQPVEFELDLLESARTLLERTITQNPTIATVTAWVLRTAYLRMTGTSHAAWMASCTTMHLLEAAGLHCEPISGSVLHTLKEDVDPGIRRGLVGVARHLNVWMSFDTGRSAVVIHNLTTIAPEPSPGSYTHEVLGLLPYCAVLDPEKSIDAEELEAVLSSVVDRTHTEPPSILGQCNMMLCICRRLKSLNKVLHGKLLEDVLALARKAVGAAQAMVEDGTPWHHMANVPFQIICILLVIDTTSSISQLKETMYCLQAIVTKYNTEATCEALRTASLLILLHQRRKQNCASNLEAILQMYPVAGTAEVRDVSGPASQPEEAGWLKNLAMEIPSVDDFGFDQLLNEGFAWDFGGNIV